jgi:hypothetical protein
MDRNPLSSRASRFAADSIPASATTTMSRACSKCSVVTSQSTTARLEARVACP